MSLSVTSVPGWMVPGLIWPGGPLTAGDLLPAQTLTPIPEVPDGTGLDLTAALVAPTSTTLQFANTLRERLYVIASVGGMTVQVNVGTPILSQPGASVPPVTLTSGHLYQFGRFHAAVDNPSGFVTVTLSATSNILVALVQDTGIY